MVAWGAVSGRLGAMGIVAVPQSASKVVDGLIYRRMNPGDRERVDHLLAQRKCAPQSSSWTLLFQCYVQHPSPWRCRHVLVGQALNFVGHIDSWVVTVTHEW